MPFDPSSPYHLKRICTLMEPEPGNANEVEGVLNPAAIRGKDGQLYLFPRLVAKGNYSRIGIARVIFDAAGEPTGVERLGIALEPEADYEIAGPNRAGCEDPRISYVAPFDLYVMTYSALTPDGPRIAVAKSHDLLSWSRIGLARFHDYKGVAYSGISDKDSAVFPEIIPDPEGKPSIAMMHRPTFANLDPADEARLQASLSDINLESMWVSYWHMHPDTLTPAGRQFVAHRRLARPEAAWENAKIGPGTPPVRCRDGWLVVYHGVEQEANAAPGTRGLIYRAGLMILSADDPHHVVYRSPQPVLSPEGDAELHGIVDGVVFPSGIDRRDDLGQADRYDVYYGMADNRIGVARLDLTPQTSA